MPRVTDDCQKVENAIGLDGGILLCSSEPGSLSQGPRSPPGPCVSAPVWAASGLASMHQDLAARGRELS